jgi:uncharacterized protein YggE
MKRIAAALVSLAAAAALFAQDPPLGAPPGPSEESISVTGIARVTVKPDRFTFTGAVQTNAPTVEEAVSQNNVKTAAVIAALKKAGATDQEIRTSGFSIYPQQEFTQGQAPRVVGYQVANSITVTKKELADAGKLLQAAVNAGMNEASGLQFVVSNPAAGREEGLRGAFEDARAKAALLAQAAGRTLGRALIINEGNTAATMPPPRPMAVRAMSAKMETGEVPVESGTQEVVYNVSVVFKMR